MGTQRADLLIRNYEANTWLIHRHLDDLSNEESFLIPAFEVISINWILGHLINSRNVALEALGRPAIWPDETAVIYRGEPDDVVTLDDGRELQALLSDLDETGQRLSEALSAVDHTAFERVEETPRGEMSLWQRIAGLNWHETYHVGQIGLLRSLVLAQRPAE
jgi:hypothetical protein